MTDVVDLQRLAEWWWGLTDEEREQGRAEFIQQMEDDPVFARAVMRVLAEEKPYMRSTVWDDA